MSAQIEKLVSPIFNNDIEVVEEHRLPGFTQFLIYLKPNATRKKREFIMVLSKATFEKIFKI